jgi:DNA polymerase-3 subunit alpha
MSILDGFDEPEEYLKQAQKLGLKGFAVTDHGNQFAWVYFAKLQKEYPDVKILYGIEFYECFDIKDKDKNNKYFHLIAITKNENGRIAINELIKKSNFEGFYYKPRVDLEILKPYANDLIILSACMASKLNNPDIDKCIKYIEEYKSIFPHFYLEIQSHDTEDQCKYNNWIIKLSEKTNTPFVITTDSHAATKENLKYQAIHVKIAKDIDSANEIYDGCYIQSEDEIHKIMDKQIGKELVNLGLKNTLNIMDLIEEINMPFQDPCMPPFNVPDGFKSENEYMWYLLKKGWINRNLDKLDSEKQQEYKKRLDYEMSVISQMKYEGYFLIVQDLVKYAKNNKIIVGDGRGSAGSSSVSYLLGITNIDPIKHNLIFERFLNPERISLPDIDIDFGDREKVLNYLENKYGKNNVCQVVNFSYITPKVAIKDTARILEIPYDIADKISKYFSSNNFEEDYEANQGELDRYKNKDKIYEELFDIARKLSGKVRQLSIHACAVGVVNNGITNYMGMHKGENDEQVIQVDKRILEEIGIVKMDLLSVKTLTVVQNTLDMLGKDSWYIDHHNPDFLNDTKKYELLCQGLTDGVFQVESYGMKELLKRIQPSNIDDVSAVLALYRPDTMGELEHYIRRKNGEEKIEYAHEDMEPILKNTYGCMIYQEQILDIVRKFGGRTYGGADRFRKGLGKKDKELVKQESEKLHEEIIQNGYSEEIAKTISNEMSLKGGYCFNKSHSIGYATLTEKTAFLKAHHPVEYFTALLNSEIGNFDAIGKYIQDAKHNFNIEILPPNINESGMYFKANNNKIIFGLSMIKGVGDKALPVIFEERNKNKFDSLNDVVKRTNLSKAIIVPLIKSGACGARNKKQLLQYYCDLTFDKTDFKSLISVPTPKELLKYDIVISNKEENYKEKRLQAYNKIRKQIFDKDQKEKLLKHRKEFIEKYMQNEDMWEFETLSMFITGNPFEKANKILKDFDTTEDKELITVVGTIINIDRKAKNGKQYAFVEIYNGNKNIELIFWNKQYSEFHMYIKKGINICAFGKKEGDKVYIEKVKSYENWKKEKGL